MANSNSVIPYTAADVVVPDGFNESVELLLQTYAKDLTPQEFSLFVADAAQRGLSIVKRQIYAVKYSGKMTIMVGIDGYRSQAESHPDYAGQDGPYWCGEDGLWKDLWLSNKPPLAAKVGVYRRGFQAPVYEIALWSEYGSQKEMWKKFPTVMLAKCAEARAIRKAFPEKVGGTYIAEEMDRRNAIETTGRVQEAPRTHLVDALNNGRQRSTATVTPVPEETGSARDHAKRILWDQANEKWGWSQETLDAVARHQHGKGLKEMDADGLTDLYRDLVMTNEEQRQAILDEIATEARAS